MLACPPAACGFRVPLRVRGLRAPLAGSPPTAGLDAEPSRRPRCVGACTHGGDSMKPQAPGWPGPAVAVLVVVAAWGVNQLMKDLAASATLPFQ